MRPSLEEKKLGGLTFVTKKWFYFLKASLTYLKVLQIYHKRNLNDAMSPYFYWQNTASLYINAKMVSELLYNVCIGGTRKIQETGKYDCVCMRCEV